MQLIDILLKKYWASTITQAEFTVLTDLLVEKKHGDSADYDEDIVLLQHGALPIMHNADKNLQLLHEKIETLENDSKKSRAKTRYLSYAFRCAAAAAVIFFFVKYLPVNPNVAKENTPVAAAITKDSSKVIFNNTKQVKHLVLSDGTAVRLYPQSRLILSSDFNINKRDVILYGQAYFTVAKNAHKPFSVQANNIVTTALGTQFLVDCRKGKRNVIVQLFEGKVVVHHFEKANKMQPVYLLPGQSCSIDLIKMTSQKISISTPSFPKNSGKKETLQTVKIARDSSSLDFNRTPLKNVFKSMEINYHIVIDYNDVKDIEQASFTGKFSSSTAAKTLLTIICATNDLLFESKENTYYIHKN